MLLDRYEPLLLQPTWKPPALRVGKPIIRRTGPGRGEADAPGRRKLPMPSSNRPSWQGRRTQADFRVPGRTPALAPHSWRIMRRPQPGHGGRHVHKSQYSQALRVGNTVPQLLHPLTEGLCWNDLIDQTALEKGDFCRAREPATRWSTPCSTPSRVSKYKCIRPWRSTRP